jgi:glycosyltransferase involved in cell wall biosynthesis
MKVALIVPGGVDRSGEHRVIPALLWLIERLAAAHEVHVFALYQDDQPSRYTLLGATVHSIGRRWGRARVLAAIAAEHRRRPFALFHAFWATPAGVIAALAGGALRRPVALHLGGGELVALPEIGYGAAQRARGRLWVRVALRGATRVTAASSVMIEAATAAGARPTRLPLGVDLRRWPRRAPQPREAGRPAKLVHVGSLNRVKDQATLLRCAEALARTAIEFSLEIIGEDTLGGETQALASTLGLGDRVTFAGFLPHRDLYQRVAGADLLLVSSRHEAGPLVVREAAVVGVPTVGTAVGHIRDWAPRAAVAVPLGDWQALAREAVQLLADEPRRLRLAAAAQALAVDEDADWTAQRVLAIYDELTRPSASHG